MKSSVPNEINHLSLDQSKLQIGCFFGLSSSLCESHGCTMWFIHQLYHSRPNSGSVWSGSEVNQTLFNSRFFSGVGVWTRGHGVSMVLQEYSVQKEMFVDERERYEWIFSSLDGRRGFQQKIKPVDNVLLVLEVTKEELVYELHPLRQVQAIRSTCSQLLWVKACVKI